MHHQRSDPAMTTQHQLQHQQLQEPSMAPNHQQAAWPQPAPPPAQPARAELQLHQQAGYVQPQVNYVHTPHSHPSHQQPVHQQPLHQPPVHQHHHQHPQSAQQHHQLHHHHHHHLQAQQPAAQQHHLEPDLLPMHHHHHHPPFVPQYAHAAAVGVQPHPHPHHHHPHLHPHLHHHHQALPAADEPLGPNYHHQEQHQELQQQQHQQLQHPNNMQVGPCYSPAEHHNLNQLNGGGSSILMSNLTCLQHKQSASPMAQQQQPSTAPVLAYNQHQVSVMRKYQHHQQGDVDSLAAANNHQASLGDAMIIQSPNPMGAGNAASAPPSVTRSPLVATTAATTSISGSAHYFRRQSASVMSTSSAGSSDQSQMMASPLSSPSSSNNNNHLTQPQHHHLQHHQVKQHLGSSLAATPSSLANNCAAPDNTDHQADISSVKTSSSSANSLNNDPGVGQQDGSRLVDCKESQLSQLHQQCAVILGEQQRSAINPIQTDNNNGTGASVNSNANSGNTTTTNNSSIISNNSTSNGNTTTRSKRLRTSFKHNQLKEMKRWFSKNQNPDAKDLKTLAQTTGLSKRVLQVWFQNARAKFRRNSAKVANQQLYDVNQHAPHILQFQQPPHQQQTYHHHASHNHHQQQSLHHQLGSHQLHSRPTPCLTDKGPIDAGQQQPAAQHHLALQNGPPPRPFVSISGSLNLIDQQVTQATDATLNHLAIKREHCD